MSFPMNLEWATDVRGLAVVVWVTAALFAAALAVLVALTWATRNRQRRDDR